MNSGKRIPLDMLITSSNDWARKNLRKALGFQSLDQVRESLTYLNQQRPPPYHPIPLSSRGHNTRTALVVASWLHLQAEGLYPGFQV